MIIAILLACLVKEEILIIIVHNVDLILTYIKANVYYHVQQVHLEMILAILAQLLVQIIRIFKNYYIYQFNILIDFPLIFN